MEEKAIVPLKFYNELKEIKENLDKNKLIFCKGGRYGYYEYIYYNADDYCKELMVKNNNLENELKNNEIKYNLLFEEFEKLSKGLNLNLKTVKSNNPWYKQLFNL